MNVTLNGQQKKFNSATSLNNLITETCKGKNHVIAEVKGSIIKRQEWDKRTISDGDTIELVNIVGGG